MFKIDKKEVRTKAVVHETETKREFKKGNLKKQMEEGDEDQEVYRALTAFFKNDSRRERKKELVLEDDGGINKILKNIYINCTF